MGWLRLGRLAAAFVALAVIAAASAASAQTPYPAYPAPPAPLPSGPLSDAAQVASCLCLHQEVDALSAELTARQQAYDAARDEVAALDTQLQQARGSVDVNNPQSVAQFRELLARRDAAFRRQRGAIFTDLSGTTERYNARVGQYNAQCTRPMSPDAIARAQATLSCPPPR